MAKVIVKSSAYQLKGKKGSISFKWKSNVVLTPENEKEIMSRLENIIGTEIEKSNQL